MKSLSDNLVLQLKKRLNDNDLGPYELEKKAGLTRGSAANILHGKSRNPTLETISSIAKVLNCTIDELLEPPEETAKKKHKKNEVEYEAILELFEQVVQLTTECLRQESNNITLEKYISILREGYVFSLTKNNKKVDRKVIEWIVDRNINSF